MRALFALTAVALLSSCARDTGTSQRSRSVEPAPQAGVALRSLCSGLNDIGFVGGVWKKGSTGYYCATSELPVGQSVLWMEVRGPSETSADTVTLGADVRAAATEGATTDEAVRKKFVQASETLLNRIEVGVDARLRQAIEADQSVAVHTGKYDVSYASDVRAGIRENRLTIRPAI
jgi:hypothetical protein